MFLSQGNNYNAGHYRISQNEIKTHKHGVGEFWGNFGVMFEN